MSCGNNSSTPKTNPQIQSIKSYEQETIDGTYSFKDNSAELKITISGSSWSGKTMMITGFGSDYDNQNAQYDNGVIKGNDLYESSGMVKVGYINGNSLTTSVGGQSVTLRKN
jgi:hypothetical protein